MSKNKILKTNRIQLTKGTIYTSTKVVHEVSDHLIRMNNKLFPKKDHYRELLQDLENLAADPQYQDHFNDTGLQILLS